MEEVILLDKMQLGLIALLKSGITGEAVPLPEGFSLEAVDRLVGKQGLMPLAFQGAQNCGISLEEPIMQRWWGRCYRNLIRSERQYRRMEELLAALGEKGLEHMPVKGCVLKKLYPRQELRPMSDADILIRQEQYPQVREVMESLGFRFVSENEHVWEWETEELHVELHKSLVPPGDGDYYGYYGTGWRFGIKGEGSRYDLSPEDTFIFLLTHFARHYRQSGIGCRHVVDLWVYRRAYPGLDLGYMEQELNRLGLKKFCRNVMGLLDVWFCGETADEIAELLTDGVFRGGSWGTVEAGMLSDAARRGQQEHAPAGRLPRIPLHMLFPSRSFLIYRYPVLLKYPILQPVIWVVRWFEILLFRPRNIKKKMKILGNMDADAISRHKSALEAVGLGFEE